MKTSKIKVQSELLAKSFEKSKNWKHIHSDGIEVYQYDYVDVYFIKDECEIHYTIMRSASDVSKPNTCKHCTKRWSKNLDAGRWNDGKEYWKLYDNDLDFEKAILRIEKLVKQSEQKLKS